MLPQPNDSQVQPGENNSEDNLRRMETIMPLLDELLGLEVPFEKVANQAMICLDKIGNKNRARYAVQVEVAAGFAELPVNCDKIEAVLTRMVTVQHTGDAPGPYITTQTWPELDVWANTTPDQLNRPVRWSAREPIDPAQYGERYVDYTFRDGGLYVGWQASPNENLRNAAHLGAWSNEVQPDEPTLLHVIYRGRISDERGYPLITPEEALACAYFSSYVDVYKRYLRRETTAQDVQFAEQLMGKHITQARLAPLGNSNELDKVLDESKRLHRHFFGDDLLIS